jgi:hypothetical protein
MSTYSHSIALRGALVLLCATLGTDASAASRLSCAWAVKSAWGFVEPNGGRLRACFESHFDKLSGPCGDRLLRAAAVGRACEAAARKFCGGVKRAAQVPGCMKPHLREVGELCMAALSKLGVKVAQKC